MPERNATGLANTAAEQKISAYNLHPQGGRPVHAEKKHAMDSSARQAAAETMPAQWEDEG
jgi:hypothetical protein